jgi:hypothetical protein
MPHEDSIPGEQVYTRHDTLAAPLEPVQKEELGETPEDPVHAVLEKVAELRGAEVAPQQSEKKDEADLYSIRNFSI